MTRSQEREGFAQSVRTRLLETDVDDLHAMFERIESAVAQVRNVLIGLLVSVVVLCIGIVINVTVVHH